MIIDPVITKIWCVRAPDTPGPNRAGHGAIVFTSTRYAENALNQAPLCITDPRVRDLYDWSSATAEEMEVISVRRLVNGRVRITLET